LIGVRKALGPLWRLWVFWTDYTHLVAEYQSTIWLGMIYYTVIGLTGVAMLLLRKPLLPSSHGRPGSHWLARDPAPHDLPSMQRLY